MLMAILGLIPGLSSLATAITTAYFNSKVQITTAKIGGDTAVAKAMMIAAAQTEASNVDRLKVIGSSWVLSFLVVGFALPWILYEWRVVVYDNVWMVGATSTPAIGGDVAGWATTIIACLFGSGTVLTAGHMFFNRKDQ
jgi:hypothetical protein